MSRKVTRRKFMAGTAAGVALTTFKFPAPAIAQGAPFKLGLLTVKTGPLAQGGIQMEQGVVTFLKEKNYTFAGRKVDFVSADTGGSPAGTKTKAQELIERDKVDAILGPLAAFELLAITDYIAAQKTPMLSLAGAEDMTQRKPNPYFLRPSATSSQAMHPMADFAAKELKLKKVVTISEDFAFGYEQMGGFQRTFEENGGRIVNKLWPPLVTPDYTPYVAQIRGLRRRVPGLRRLQSAALHEDLRRVRSQISGGNRRNRRRRRAAARLRRRGASACISCCPYTLDSAATATSASSRRCRRTTASTRASMLRASMSPLPLSTPASKRPTANPTTRKPSINGAALRELKDTPRGQIKFDHLGNVIGDFYVRRVEKANGQARQQDGQDVQQCQPVLDLRREDVPRAAGLFTQLSAAED